MVEEEEKGEDAAAAVAAVGGRGRRLEEAALFPPTDDAPGLFKEWGEVARPPLALGVGDTGAATPPPLPMQPLAKMAPPLTLTGA